MKVLFLSNIPSPYRVEFFNEFGKYCELTVTFEGRTATDRNENWKNEGAQNFRLVMMKGIRTKSDQFFCPMIKKVIREGFDHIIVGVYSTPTSMYAMDYMRRHGIRFWIEADGGYINENENKLKKLIKAHYISSAAGWFSTGRMTTDFLCYYGADRNKCHIFPFTSLKKTDIIPVPPSMEEKQELRFELKMSSDKMIILSVGQFIYRN